MTIEENIRLLKNEIDAAAIKNNRAPTSIQLVAVTKGQSYETILQAYQAGIRDFGENYYQEAKNKMAFLTELPITWHYLGRLQSNKASFVANTFSWVHSLDRLSIAALLNANRLEVYSPLQVCIQVNLDKEGSKAGILEDDLLPFIQELRPLKNLQLRGLMAIPKPGKNKRAQSASFKHLSVLLERINRQFSLHLDTLSMGMSEDYLTAIEAGSTCLRIGRAIFGERQK